MVQHTGGRDPEATLSEYVAAYAGREGSAGGFVLRRPAATARAGLDLLRLPRIDVALDDTVEGRAIRTGIVRSGVNYRLLLGLASVLVLPQHAEEYSLGASKQTLRRKARAAVRAGVTWKPVEDLQERERLRELADLQERVNPRPAYRVLHPDNRDLLDHRLWLVAYDVERRPILLSVTPVDGESAILRYFRTLVDSEVASATRYLMTQVLAETLVGQGVRYLFDNGGPLMLPNGLRHFQRMMGYRLMRVHVTASR